MDNAKIKELFRLIESPTAEIKFTGSRHATHSYYQKFESGQINQMIDDGDDNHYNGMDIKVNGFSDIKNYRENLTLITKGFIRYVKFNYKEFASKYEYLVMLQDYQNRCKIVLGKIVNDEHPIAPKTILQYNGVKRVFMNSERSCGALPFEMLQYVYAIRWSANFIVEELEGHIELVKEMNINFSSPPITSNVKWDKNPIDLIEIIVALEKTKSIVTVDGTDITRDMLYLEFSRFFNIQLNNAETNLSQGISGRNRSKMYLMKMVDTFELHRKNIIEKRKEGMH